VLFPQLEEMKQGNKKYEGKHNRRAKFRDGISRFKPPCSNWDNMKIVFSF
jgi:hypothetical protein